MPKACRGSTLTRRVATASKREMREAETRPAGLGHQIWTALGLARRNWPGRYTILLVSILAMVIIQPIFADHQRLQGIVTLSMSLVLLSALYTLNLSRAYFTVGLLLMVPAFIGRWILQFHHSQGLEVFAATTASAFILMTVTALVRELFSIKRVTLDSISAAICAYLLLGVGWGFIFAIIEMEHPGSFTAELFIPNAGPGSPIIRAFHNFIYYSFVCLTTTGYGDIAPKSDMARVMSVLESITGQMYLAILIARLVSLEVAQSMIGDR